MLILGCRPKGRLTEQHDVFFGIASSLKALIPAIKRSWPEAKGVLHIDAWRKVTQVGNYAIQVQPRTAQQHNQQQLFFINLGGYKPGEFEEFHYKLLAVAKDKGAAIQQSKQTAFYKHAGFKGAVSHIDDKYGIDVDELYEIKDLLQEELKDLYHLSVAAHEADEDPLHIGYFRLDKLNDTD
jgi:hypothetical protein